MQCVDPVVVLGAQRYVMQRNWVESDVDLRGISSVAVLGNGLVAGLFRTAPHVRLFDAHGRLAAQWDIPDIVCPHHITALADGGALVTDLDGHRVFGLDAHGKVEWVLGDAGRPQWMKPFNHPTQAAVSTNGDLYVSDGYGNVCLHHFDTGRTLVNTVGEAGSGPGQFSTPHAVVIDAHDRIFVADRENSRVQVFDVRGQFQHQITAMYKPMSLALTPSGHLLVSDQTAALSLFDAAGTLLGRCRVLGVYGHGLAAGPDGTIYISEMIPDRLTRLSPLDT